MSLLLPALALLLSGSAMAETTVTESEGTMSISFQQTVLPTDRAASIGFPILDGPDKWHFEGLPPEMPGNFIHCQTLGHERWRRTTLAVINDWGGQWPANDPTPPPKAVLTFDKRKKAMRSGNRLQGQCLAKSGDGQDVVVHYDITVE